MRASNLHKVVLILRFLSELTFYLGFYIQIELLLILIFQWAKKVDCKIIISFWNVKSSLASVLLLF